MYLSITTQSAVVVLKNWLKAKKLSLMSRLAQSLPVHRISRVYKKRFSLGGSRHGYTIIITFK